jgi:hypothetical protein
MLIDRDADFLPTKSRFFQFDVDLIPIFMSGNLNKNDIEVLFFLLQHMQNRNISVLPKYEKITNYRAPFNPQNLDILRLTPKSVSTSLKQLKDLGLIKKIRNGVFIINPYLISNERGSFKERTQAYYDSI